MPRPNEERRSREPLKFHSAQAPLRTPGSPSVGTPPAAVAPVPSRRMPPPLPARAVDRFKTVPDAELTTSDLLDDADVEDDVEDPHIDVVLDEEPVATTRTAPPPEPSPRASPRSFVALVGGLVVSLAGVAAALLSLEGRPAASPSAATSNVALATLDAVSPVPASEPSPSATETEATLAAKTAKAHRAHPSKSKAIPPKPARATNKRAKPPVARAVVKKAGKAPAKQ